MSYGTITPLLQAKLDEHRKERNAKCELAWKDLESGVIHFERDAAAKHGVSKFQFARWIAMHKGGQLSRVRSRLGLTLNGRKRGD